MARRDPPAVTRPDERLRPRRRIRGSSAVLLPFTAAGDIDWGGFEAHVVRTAQAGLVPAVNMDTGYVHALDAATRTQVLDATAGLVDTFVAGAFVADRPGAPLDAPAYHEAVAEIASRGGTPLLFPSHGLNALAGPKWAEAQGQMARHWDSYLAFELGPAFAPQGRIYELCDYRLLLEIPQCIGAKHSSLSRDLEWQRLELRDSLRPDFSVLTGNDLAIDMVMYGSDYLLGLSTCAPEAFARRDHYWADGDARFYELNDLLQYLGQLIFRPPLPAYRHSAAQVMRLRGWIESDATPLLDARRPDSDVEMLRDILERIDDRLA